MTDSILDEFDRAGVLDGHWREPFAARFRCVALNVRDGKPCKRHSCGIVADRAYCSKHIGAARERDGQ